MSATIIPYSVVLCVCACVCVYIYIYIYNMGGPGSSVGIATDDGLDGPGSNPGGADLGSTQPPVKWVPPFSQA